MCRQIKDGVSAIFGPSARISGAHVQSICEALEIPHIATRWSSTLEDASDDVQGYSINLFPEQRLLSKAYVDILVKWGWRSFTILYENNEGKNSSSILIVFRQC